jgi:hypothetical protein
MQHFLGLVLDANREPKCAASGAAKVILAALGVPDTKTI